MHRDTKLGLALGILVIGFAAAFCFPRPNAELPIAGADSAATGPSAPEIELIPVRAYRQALPKHPPLEILLNPPPQSEDAPAEVVPATTAFPGRTEMLHDPDLIGLSSARAIDMGTSQDAAAAGKGAARSPRPDDLLSPQTSGGSHVVQHGDTLSGIALRYLGSSARFHEIFEANRDKLASPDALKLGMVLTIPPRQLPAPPDRSSAPMDLTEQIAPDVEAAESITEQPSNPLRFRRVEAAPFVTPSSGPMVQRPADDTSPPR